jgi:N-acetylglucosamine kinase
MKPVEQAFHILGVDGGGTKMAGCLLRSDGELLTLGQAPPANYARLRGEIAQPLLQFLRALQEQAQLPKGKIALAGICSTGVGRASDRELLTGALQRVDLAETIIVDSDAMSALTGSFAGGPGIIVYAGTGAFAHARTPDGNVIRVGGWGYLIGDEGSGFHLAQQALNAALQDWDGRGEQTSLRPAFEKLFGVSSIELIISKIYDPQFDRGQMAALAPIVFEQADRGDRVALRVVAETGFELGRLAKAALQKSAGRQIVEIALLGNLFRRSDALLPSFWKALHAEKERLRVVEPQFEAAIGASLLALERSGFELYADFLARLKASYERLRANEGLRAQ